MASPLVVEARRRLRAFVRREASLTDLYRWLAEQVVATSAEASDAELRETLGHTILYLYEYQDGYRTREEIRAYIARLIGESPLVEADHGSRAPAAG